MFTTEMFLQIIEIFNYTINKIVFFRRTVFQERRLTPGMYKRLENSVGGVLVAFSSETRNRK